MKKMSQESQEISLVELISKIQTWAIFLFTKWKSILFFSFLGGTLGLTYAFLSPEKYVAELNFALEEKTGTSSYSAIASQFGVDLGTGANGGAFAGDNLLQLLQSRMMLEKTLLSSTIIDGKEDLLINRYINFNGLDDKLKQNNYKESLVFHQNVDRSKYTISQDSFVNIIQNRIRSTQLFIKRPEKKLNLVQVSFVSNDELFAKYFAEKLVSEASIFYIETKTQKTRKNIQILEARIDSVKNELDNRLVNAAVSQDQNFNLVRARVRVPYAKTQIDIQLLTALYAELSKNLELSRFSLMKEEPLVQIIDLPRLPLKIEKPGKLMSIIIFGFIFGFLHVSWVVVKKLMNSSYQRGDNR
jgi:uncharacterized protein involved in exopolysaccharide biosynthesis